MPPIPTLQASSYDFGSSDFYLQMTNGRDLYPHLHSHEFYEINCLISGRCCQRLNERQVAMEPGFVVFLRPGDNHRLHSQAKGTNLLSLSVKRGCVERFLNAYGQPTLRQLLDSPEVPFMEQDSQAADYIADAYRSLLCADFQERELYCSAILNKVIQSFALYAARRSALNADTVQANHVLFHTLNEMHNPQNIAEGLPALERIAGYSRPQLCRLFHRYLHMTPYQYIHDLRMDFACSLVSHTSLSIAEIAERTGFLSASHFAASFKKHFGETPLQMRKNPHKFIAGSDDTRG